MSKKILARTFMPEIMAPGTGLSPLTNKSIMPTQGIPSILDILNGQSYRLPDSGGAWGKPEDEMLQPSYKEDGDAYKREERFWEILQKNATPDVAPEKWIVEMQGGKKIFDSMPEALNYSNYLKENNRRVFKVRKIAQFNEKNLINSSVDKCFEIIVEDSQTMTQSIGSAFCVAPNYFLTCAHVIRKYNKNAGERLDLQSIKKNEKIKLLRNEQIYSAAIVAVDEALDLALLFVNVSCDHFVLTKDMFVGLPIFTIGSPHGFENNATFGNVNSMNRRIYKYKGAPDYFFFDANVFTGNSGGPIVNAQNGHIIGMVTAVTAPIGDYGLNAGLPEIYLEKFLKQHNIAFEVK